MSTALFSTSREAARSVADVVTLFRFRLAGLRGRARRVAPVAVAGMLTVTALAATVPAWATSADVSRRDVLLLLPTGYLSVLLISVVSAAASGGGRELLPRDQAVAFPVSPTTDHLGAFVMVPLNIAWLLQCSALLAGTAYAVGPRPELLAAQAPVVAWMFAATATAQALAWAMEWVRRGPAGRLVVRALAVLLTATLLVLVATDRLAPLLDHSPTVRITLRVLDGATGRWGPWARGVLLLLGTGVAALVVGALVARSVARRPARDEARGETAVRPSRPHPGSDLAGLLRTDRAAIWRSVPMRRGLVVLVLFPGLVAVAGSFEWDLLGILPGLVASGGALLFGVNSWCLDGRGALWRESLPVSPRLVFVGRAVVLAEVLLVTTAVTLLVAAVRAGMPTVSQLVAVLCATVVVTVQVVATSLRWSVRRPFAVDMRSARATPAPPLVMVGYSTRLALTTTLTGLAFNALSAVEWPWAVLCASVLMTWSGVRLARTADAWADPVTRAQVVVTVAG